MASFPRGRGLRRKPKSVSSGPPGGMALRARLTEMVGCLFTNGHVDYLSITILKLNFDILIRPACFLISVKEFLENAGVRKGTLT